MERQKTPNKGRRVEVEYTEKRVDPTDGYIQGTTYPYPTGEKPIGANCLSDCDA